MVSVDDLVISLRIDETSDLGKLQKQLEALVGPKGEKAISLGTGITPDIKADLNKIKADLMLLTPTVLTSKETVMRAALALANRVRNEENLSEALLDRYNMEEERLNEFVEQLLDVAGDTSKLNSDQNKRFVTEMEKFILMTDMAEGDRKSLVTKLIGMLDEVNILQQKVQDAFTAGGVGYRGQYQVYKITKNTIEERFDEYIKHYEGIDEERFNELKEIFKKNTDPLRAMEKAYRLMFDKDLDIEQLDKETIKNVDELREILISQIAASLKESTYMLGDFYKAGKDLTGGKAFGVGGPKRLDLVVKGGLKAFFDEHGGIVKFGEIKETEKNILTELKLVATKEDIEKTVQERINQGFTTIRIVAEEVKQSAIDAAKELLSKEIYKDIDLALVEILVRGLQISTGTEADLKRMHEEAVKKTGENIEKLAEKIEEDLETGIDEIVDPVREIEDNIRDLIKRTAEQDPENLRNILKELFGISDVVEESARKQEEILDKVEAKEREGIEYKGENVEHEL